MDVKLVVHQGPTQAREFRVRSEETIIGRKEGCALRIPSSQVSRLHCKLVWRDDLLHVEDLKSANGTRVNGQRVRGLQVLRPGDLLTVGPLTFLVNYQLTQRAIDRLLAEVEPPVQQESAPELDVEVVEAEEAAPQEDDLAPISMDADFNPLQDLAAIQREAEEAADTSANSDEGADEAEQAPPRPRRKSPRSTGLQDDEPTMQMSPEVSLPPIKPSAKKKPAKKKKKRTVEEEANPDASAILGSRGPLTPPDDVRDLLSQLGEGEEE